MLLIIDMNQVEKYIVMIFSVAKNYIEHWHPASFKQILLVVLAVLAAKTHLARLDVI